MRAVRLFAFVSLALATTSARAQDTTSVRDTLAYTTTIVTVRAQPFPKANRLLRSSGRAHQLAPWRRRVSARSLSAVREAATNPR